RATTPLASSMRDCRSAATPRPSNQSLPPRGEPSRSASRIAAVAPGNFSCQASATGANASTHEPAPCRNTSSRRGACADAGGSSSHNWLARFNCRVLLQELLSDPPRDGGHDRRRGDRQEPRPDDDPREPAANGSELV